MLAFLGGIHVVPYLLGCRFGRGPGSLDRVLPGVLRHFALSFGWLHGAVLNAAWVAAFRVSAMLKRDLNET